eukprot:GHVL01030680.1.p1 GENE.GHVL01030680.1~~GHVL01030680.1.p1  ORF type:complete len:1021 (+),score=209.04 GHVL01030680.1:126-3188(+)
MSHNFQPRSINSDASFQPKQDSTPEEGPRLVLSAMRPSSKLPTDKAIQCMDIGSSVFILSYLNGELVKWASDTNTISLIEFPKSITADRRRISRLFVDPLGYHMLVESATGDSFYVSLKSVTIKPLIKLRGIFIEAVGWNQSSTEATTNEVLIGTQNGSLQCVDNLSKDKPPVQVFELPNRMPVLAIKIKTVSLLLSNETSNQKYTDKILITVASRRHLFAFIGESHLSLASIFSQYSGDAVGTALAFEVPSDINRCDLLLVNPVSASSRQLELIWMTGAGILIATLRPTSPSPKVTHGPVFMVPPVFIRYPWLDGGSMSEPSDWDIASSNIIPPPGPPPVSIGVSQYNIILLYDNRIVAISRISHEVVIDENLPRLKFGSMQRLMEDPSSRQIILRSSKDSNSEIYKLKIENEQHRIWRLFLDKLDFKNALRNVKTSKDTQIVISNHASHLMREGKYNEAAVLYSESASGVAFEDVVLSFLTHKQESALVIYLTGKLDQEDKKQRINKETSPAQVMLFVWLVELRLYILLKKEKMLQSEEKGRDVYHELEKELRRLLANYSDIDAPESIIYDLLHSYNQSELLLHYAEHRGDVETYVQQLLCNGRYSDCIAYLSSKRSNLKSARVFLRHCSILFEKCPQQFANASLLPEFSKIDPIKIAPAMICHSKISTTHLNAAKYFFNRVIRNSTGGARTPTGTPALGDSRLSTESSMDIGNALLFLYASCDGEEEVIKFIKGNGGHYNNAFGLRVCEEFGHYGCVSLLYGMMNLYHDGLKSALEHNYLKLAEEIASMPTDAKVQRSLWMKILEHEVVNADGIMEIIHNQQSPVTINDFLPWIQDNVAMKNFQEEISKSLDSYETAIQHLSNEMIEHRRAANQLKEEMENLKKRTIPLKKETVCEICRNPPFKQPTVVFPCGHAFHVECMAKLLSKSIAYSPIKRNKLQELTAKLFKWSKPSEDSTKSVKQPEDHNMKPSDNIGKLEKDLHALLSEECILCGSWLIQTISVPLVTEDDIKTNLLKL